MVKNLIVEESVDKGGDPDEAEHRLVAAGQLLATLHLRVTPKNQFLVVICFFFICINLLRICIVTCPASSCFVTLPIYQKQKSTYKMVSKTTENSTTLIDCTGICEILGNPEI